MLEIHNLNISYGKRVIIKNQDMQFEHGKIVGITGASGEGKSSILNVLGLIKKPDKLCKYIYEGEEIDYNDEKAASLFRLNHIGFIFQDGNLLNNLTAMQNVMLPMMMCEKSQDIIEQEAQRWIDYVDIDNVKDGYPDTLSGGEEQRAAVARALINDCDIILADEPTASLDNANSDNIMKLLVKLAHKLKKMVIVVSHDENVIGYCDEVYRIENCELRKAEHESAKEETSQRSVTVLLEKVIHKKQMMSFISKYEKFRKKEKRLNKILIFIAAIAVSVASISVGFGKNFTKEQRKFLNAISDRGILVINDTLGIDVEQDYDGARSFDGDIVKQIEDIPNVDKVYPYYKFISYDANNTHATSSLTVYDNDRIISMEKYVEPNASSQREFIVVPKFSEENLSAYLINGTQDKDGVILMYNMALSLSDEPESLVGKYIEIECYVPVEKYVSKATNPSNIDEKLDIDLNIYKRVKFKKKISGVLDKSYVYDKTTEASGNVIFLNSDEMYAIIDKNKGNTDTQEFVDAGFTLKELAPSVLLVYVNDFEDINNVKDKISRLSVHINVVSKAMDIKRTKENLALIRQVMLVIAIILISVVSILFGFLYYYKNRDRKKEIGIIKALGFSNMDTLLLVGYDVAINTVITFVSAVFISFIFSCLVNNIMFGEYITFGILNIVIAFAISFVAVFASGMLSVLKTSRIDVIDAIRTNK